jgi:Zn-dependent protease with chaperone function
MSDRSDAFQPGISSSNSSGLLQAGLLALKQKDYRRAIERLEAVGQTSPTRSDRLKAEMGLVKAYTRMQQFQKAIDLCQALCSSKNPQVQGWAHQMLSDLERRYRLYNRPAPGVAPGEEPIATSEADETGFVPIEGDTTDSTGFIPSVIGSSQVIAPPEQTDFPKENSSKTDQEAPATEPVVPACEPPPSPAPSQLIHLSGGETASQRLQKWSSLGNVDRSSFWALQAGTLAFLVWWISALLSFGRDRLNQIFLSIRFDFLNLSLWVTYFDPFWIVLIGLTGLFFASPWLLDLVLKACYGMEDLRRSELESFSPEALRLLKRLTGSRSLPFPTLKRLPTAVPLCFAYGDLPRHARMVVSQGLLERLEPDEIAVLFAGEWAHLTQREVGILSLAAIVTQLPYLVYWYAASWGDRQSNGFLRSLAIGVSSVAYGVYWLLRIPALLLSRIRLYFSDRTAAELTGNPNGLSRALLKLTSGMAETLAQHGSTPPLVESFDLLMPVSYRQSLTLGSFYQQTSRLDLLQWDCHQLDRTWLNVLNSHPLLGDRLSQLANYARHWRLEPQISWEPQQAGSAANSRFPLPRSPLQRTARLYFAPFLGILGGWLLAGLLWAIGFVAKRLGWLEIDWLWADWSVITGLGLIGFSIGTFLRINAFFPDIKRAALQTEPDLVNWLSDPAALPIDNHPVRLQGQLLGRRGILNRLHQDLFLQIAHPAGEAAAQGMIRLHYTSRFGSLGDVLLEVLRPQIWLAPPPKTVTVIGWFRRGAVPWIDVETIQSPRGTIAHSEHPLWSTILGTIAALAGAFVIFAGGS